MVFCLIILALIILFGPIVAENRKAAQEHAKREYDRRMSAADADAQRIFKTQVDASKKKAQEKQAAARSAEKAAREEERRRKQEEKLNAARQLAEYRERALQAEKELRSIRAEKPAHETVKPAAQVFSLDEFAARQTDKKPAASPANNAPQSFAHEIVAFTGILPTMTRKEAIAATIQRGGKAYETINTTCTLLVIGQRPGNQQQERAERWNIKTITWEEWFKRAEISWKRRQFMQAQAAS
jgi:NAD-dependent DNA ligase